MAFLSACAPRLEKRLLLVEEGKDAKTSLYKKERIFGYGVLLSIGLLV